MARRKSTSPPPVPATITVEAVVRSVYGSPGDVLHLNPTDSRVGWYLSVGVLRELPAPEPVPVAETTAEAPEATDPDPAPED